MDKKTCPRCKSQVSASARFCENCGWRFNTKQEKRYKEIVLENVSLKELGDWALGAAGTNEIVSINANIQHRLRGTLVNSREFYVKQARVRYCPDSPGHTYAYAYLWEFDGAFSSGQKKVDNYVEGQMRDAQKVVMDITRHSHFSGGGARELWCRMAIWEI